MSDLISKEALYEATKDTTDVSYMAAMILCAPAVDAAEVVHGEWLEEDGVQICSECGEEHEWEDFRATYCDNFGAKMDKRKESENTP